MANSGNTRYKRNLFKSSSRGRQIVPTDIIITECATNRCEDCTGTYSNWILGHRFVCNCKCHFKGENK